MKANLSSGLQPFSLVHMARPWVVHIRAAIDRIDSVSVERFLLTVEEDRM